ncbi:MAG: peptidoglycan-binding protein [Oscillospiraceae bacterium]|nr:peptidoglycan-binding protein [Oscillospiraceae bacterium]
MSVRIGHASIAETGTVNGTAGDQTGREVCTRSWWDGGWLFAAIHPDAGVRERHAAAVEAACANDQIGYSQNSRNTLYQQAKAVGLELARIKVKCNCDCSSLQNCAAVASGAPGVGYGSNGWTTRTMEAELRKAGYVILKNTELLRSSAYCVRGMIYVSSGHTVCGLDNGSKAADTLRIAGTTGGSSSAGEETPAPAKTVPLDFRYKVPLPLLKQGASGPYVKALQWLLIGRGLSCGGEKDDRGVEKPDGQFGTETKKAVITFQRYEDLTVDGEAGGEVWDALHRM